MNHPLRPTDEALGHLLERADRALRTSDARALDVDRLEHLVTRRQVKRKLARTGVAAMLLLVAVVGAVWQLSRPGEAPRVQRSTDPPESANPAQGAFDLAAARADLLRLRASVRQRTAMVAAMRRHRQSELLRDELAELEQSSLADDALRGRLAWQREVDRAAISSLMVAHRLALDSEQLAVVEYRRVADRFPETIWSETASQAIGALEDRM